MLAAPAPNVCAIGAVCMHECMLASWPDPRLGLVLQVMFEEIEIIRPIGEGSFGRVRRRKGDLPCWGVQAALCLCPPPCLAPAAPNSAQRLRRNGVQWLPPSQLPTLPALRRCTCPAGTTPR